MRTLLTLAVLAPAAAPLAAQATGPQSNLIFGIAAGVTGREDLWSVPRQPVGALMPPDTLGLTRELGAGVGAALHAIYFPGSTLGFTGELFVVGNSYDDACENRFTGGSDSTFFFACRGIDGDSRSTTTVLTSVGMVARAFPRGAISPYVRLAGGLSYTSRSSTATGTPNVIVYDTGDGASLRPTAIAGLGFTARSGVGDLQIRMEIRDSYVGYAVVTGPGTPAPPTEVRYHHLVSVLFGIDLVLEKSRGRRY